METSISAIDQPPLTFDQLPIAVHRLSKQVEELRKLLTQNKQPQESDRWFDLEEACIYIPDKPSKLTVYGWVHTGTIPVHKRGKKLYFLKSEIDLWLKQGRKKTLAETEAEADKYVGKRKK